MAAGVTGVHGAHAVKVADKIQLKQGTGLAPIQHLLMEGHRAMERQHHNNSCVLLYHAQ
jgi:hypothetical protein